MQWVVALLGFVGGIGAAGISAAIGVRHVSRSMAADVRARWDASLLEKSSAFVVAAGSVRHLSQRFQRAADKDMQRAKTDEAHEQLRILAEQIRLLGDERVQRAVRDVVHHVYSVRVQGEEGMDPRAGDYPGTEPVRRLGDALQEFYKAVRVQLRAPDAENVLPDGVGKLHPGMKPLGWDERSQIAQPRA